jgi:two-component system OmpR family response regulator
LVRPTADGSHPLRLLVVDDEPSICQALSLLFKWHGLEVVTALSASEANHLLTQSHIDVLLIDLRLRDARGDAVFRAALELDPTFQERTLFMTGDITAEAERIIAATNCPYLRKPFDITLAVQAIAALVGVAYLDAPTPRSASDPSLGSGPEDTAQ